MQRSADQVGCLLRVHGIVSQRGDRQQDGLVGELRVEAPDIQCSGIEHLREVSLCGLVCDGLRIRGECDQFGTRGQRRGD